MKYTQTTDSIVNSIAHILTQATQAYLQYAVDSEQIPLPFTQEEVDKVGKEFLMQLALAAVTKATFNPEGVLYNEELAPLMELLADNTMPAINNLINNRVQCIIELRPEGTPSPTSTPEETDPIIKAKQGKSNIIIPGIND